MPNALAFARDRLRSQGPTEANSYRRQPAPAKGRIGQGMVDRIEPCSTPTVRVIAVLERERMHLRTPRHTLTTDKFDRLGSDVKTLVRRAIIYVKGEHSCGGSVLVRCVVVEGPRVKPNIPRTLIRNRTRCLCCRGEEKLTSHHIVPRSRGGKENEYNLAVLCEPCHVGLEQRIERMERTGSNPPLCYMDYVAVLVTFTLATRHRMNGA